MRIYEQQKLQSPSDKRERAIEQHHLRIVEIIESFRRKTHPHMAYSIYEQQKLQSPSDTPRSVRQRSSSTNSRNYRVLQTCTPNSDRLNKSTNSRNYRVLQTSIMPSYQLSSTNSRNYRVLQTSEVDKHAIAIYEQQKLQSPSDITPRTIPCSYLRIVEIIESFRRNLRLSRSLLIYEQQKLQSPSDGVTLCNRARGSTNSRNYRVLQTGAQLSTASCNLRIVEIIESFRRLTIDIIII